MCIANIPRKLCVISKEDVMFGWYVWMICLDGIFGRNVSMVCFNGMFRWYVCPSFYWYSVFETELWWSLNILIHRLMSRLRAALTELRYNCKLQTQLSFEWHRSVISRMKRSARGLSRCLKVKMKHVIKGKSTNIAIWRFRWHGIIKLAWNSLKDGSIGT